MNTKEIVKRLIAEDSTISSIAELERKLDIANGTINKWDKSQPTTKVLEKLADYFDVSIDFLLGRTKKKHYYSLTDKDERDIQKVLEKIIEDLSAGGALAFSKDSNEVDKETRELLIASLENSLRIAKIEAENKCTPKKYRDEHGG
ncbi:helix-turn-helix domain-containing protein [Vagococcus elongatus]|uniref:Transcriptional regulator n=1 Tax=Vagococcus elongatus TaxID=180344 RepID=A0A430APW8_9ENTE|nr:helix-turn-helix transcriptional regulator [Vagococcus elongatus]RSU10139.1 transcriptional regulator [Vagococcus elongatus]